MTARGNRANPIRHFAVACLAVVLVAAGVWHLEGQRAGLAIEHTSIGTTPVTFFLKQGAQPAPLVVVAHGFAGSRQLMEAYSLALARAGYVVAAFDFEGHGRNPVPMSGDVDAIEGTTQLLVAETLKVMQAGLDRPETDGRVAILGHSMASDIIIRAAAEDPRIGPVVAISAFSQAVTKEHPENLLLISGAWEGGLRAFALGAVKMLAPEAGEGETVRSADGSVVRRAFVAPNAEHVGVLFSRAGVAEAVNWLNTAFEKTGTAEIPQRGGWIFAVLFGLVLLVWPLSALLPDRAPPHKGLSPKVFAAALLAPMLAAPALAIFLPRGFLPVLVADYLAVHMLLYGGIQLVILRGLGLQVTVYSLSVGALLAAYGILGLGFAFDRYFISFAPHADRLPIIAVLAAGALAFMLADSAMAHACPKLWQRALIRLSFLASLAIAVALDFERLFFLVLIIPIILAFFLVFGLMGRWVEARAGPFASGFGLALLLAWSLGVTFPMFS
ncbi:alpha/beta hydrolase [Roseibium denhamense]|uniref:Serine aminopeptidase, S33 n=1 Tax=Roseibium denhamense TaxID=76305 RepID=A0ABY1P3H3_9HYPH|nr:alpha/beta fold hydrolase [Roseibium denhamense]MTI07578.1 alpha/beta hydrolase [Roseibium denhamense]SMP23911.1 Serine aminopeptidase, S33 [Roseibium denhamense]